VSVVLVRVRTPVHNLDIQGTRLSHTSQRGVRGVQTMPDTSNMLLCMSRLCSFSLRLPNKWHKCHSSFLERFRCTPQTAPFSVVGDRLFPACEPHTLIFWPVPTAYITRHGTICFHGVKRRLFAHSKSLISSTGSFLICSRFSALRPVWCGRSHSGFRFCFTSSWLLTASESASLLASPAQ